MEVSEKQKAIDLIQKSQKILILTHENPDGDALGSLLAMYLFLKKLGKEVTAVCADQVPHSLSFLPSAGNITSNIEGVRDFIIMIDLSQARPEKLSYNIENNKLNIVITPKEGSFSEKDVSFSYGDYRFDLIVVLDSPSLDRIGEIRQHNKEIFYNTPILNIDHHPGNEDFGQVNLVEITATSTAEILFSLFEAINSKLMDPDIATCLLAGIITDTGSFQNTNTTPKSLTMAAQLVAAGARQQEIIQNIFKNRSLNTLKLWGEALSRLKYDEVSKIAYTFISYEDFKRTGSNSTEGLIDELLSSVPEAQVVLLLSEKEPGKIYGSLRTKDDVDASLLAKVFGGGGHRRAAGFTIESVNIQEAERQIIEKIKEFLAGGGSFGPQNISLAQTKSQEPLSSEQRQQGSIIQGGSYVQGQQSELATNESQITENQKEPQEAEANKENNVFIVQEPVGQEENIENTVFLPEQKEEYKEPTMPNSVQKVVGQESGVADDLSHLTDKEKEEFEKWLKKIRGEN